MSFTKDSARHSITVYNARQVDSHFFTDTTNTCLPSLNRKYVVQAVPGFPIDLPLDAPPVVVLSVAYHHTPTDIAKAGLSVKVAEAEDFREAKIAQALIPLHEFGVTWQELRQLVDEKMRGTARP
jgi:hypothetical protein